MERAHTEFFANLIVSNPKKTNERRPQQAHPRNSEHIRKSTNFSCEFLFLDPRQLCLQRRKKTPALPATSLSIYVCTIPLREWIPEKALPCYILFWLQTSWSILSDTETICLWPKEKLGGRQKKKKKQASLLVSFANGAGLGIADAGTVLEFTICHSCLTRQRDIFKCCCRTNTGKHACCLPKTSFSKVQLLLLQICRGEGFPYVEFWTLFCSFAKWGRVVWEHIWIGGILTLWNVDPGQKRSSLKKRRKS